MNEPDQSTLAIRWWQALTATGVMSTPSEPTRRLLAGLLDQLSACLDAEPFDHGAGTRVGRQLAAVGLTDPIIPIVSAQVLCELAPAARRRGIADADQRVAALLAALGQGHQAGCSTHPDQFRTDAAERFRIVFDNAAVAIAIGDTTGTLLDANRGLADMIGVPVESLRGISIYHFAHPDDRDEITSVVFDNLIAAATGTVKLERRLVRTDGEVRWVAFAITYVRGADGAPDYLLAVGEDVTERHRLEQRLHHQARHDPLTGLPNRRYLLERIDTITADAQPHDRAGLCFIDLDQFKRINDHYGHQTGDQALAAVADRLRDAVDDQDCLLARLGGDEFVAVIAPPADDQRVSAIAQQLVSALAAPLEVGQHRLHLSASIGAVVTAPSRTPAHTLLDIADRQLYHAKTRGKNQWVLDTHTPADAE